MIARAKIMLMSITDTRVANIRALIEEMGSQASFCRRFNLNPTYISQLLNGHRTFGERAARKIEAKLGVPPGWLDRLQTGEGPMEADLPAHLTRVPVISCVQAGDWTPVADDHPPGNGFDYLTTDLKLSDGAFALEITGDSMLPDFRPGDRVIIDPAVEPRPGDFVVAKLEAEPEATFKKYRLRAPGVVELAPLNDDYPTIIMDDAHPGRVIGVMVEHRRYRRDGRP